jgi:hypothetical protein
MADTLLFVAGSAVDAKKQPAHHTIYTITKINRLNGFSRRQVRPAVHHTIEVTCRWVTAILTPWSLEKAEREGEGPYPKNKLQSSVGYQPYTTSRSQR